ncbi:MAG: AarF/UbiB family protein [Candidatus Woesearchaeota archaeon]
MFGFRKKFRDMNRVEKIIKILLKYEMGYFLQRINLSINKQAQKDLQPETLRMILQELGGGFIKLGQFLSLRPDLIPHRYCEELSRLQDEVKPFSAEEVKKTIETDLKKPINKIFSYFDFKPIAAASIGQVHTGFLKGKKIAVKVQRPHIKEIMKTDIEILEYFTELLNNKAHKLPLNPIKIFEEFKLYTEHELNYLNEATNIQNFYYKNLKGEVKIPFVYKELCTQRVLVMEFIEGKEVKFFKNKPEKIKKIIFQKVINAVFKNIFLDGVFHADPHPGNIIVIKNYDIAFIDFGVVGYIDDVTRDNLSDLFISLITKDLDGIARSMIRLGIVSRFVNEELLKDDLRSTIGSYYNTGLDKINITSFFYEIISIAYKYNIIFPANFALLAKSIITLEGFALDFEPKFNLVKTGEPFIKKLIRQKTSPEEIVKRVYKNTKKIKDFIVDLPDTSKHLAYKIEEGSEKIYDINKNIATLSKEVIYVFNRILLGIIISGLMISGALLVNFGYQLSFGVSIISLLAFITAGALIVILLLESFKKY